VPGYGTPFVTPFWHLRFFEVASVFLEKIVTFWFIEMFYNACTVHVVVFAANGVSLLMFS
jgi:hypothetical protein